MCVICSNCPADSSFLVTDGCTAPRPQPARAPPCQEEPGSLSPARSWRAADSPPPSPPSPGSPGTSAERASPDLFISDGRALAAYIRLVNQCNVIDGVYLYRALEMNVFFFAADSRRCAWCRVRGASQRGACCLRRRRTSSPCYPVSGVQCSAVQ